IFHLEIKADLENLTDLAIPGPGYDWSFKVRCTNCREDHENYVLFNAEESFDLPRSRGTANFIMKCKFCSSDSSASIVDKSNHPYNAEDSGRWKRIVSVESRGMELIGWIATRGQSFRATGAESGTEFEVDVYEDDDGQNWVGYDEEGKCPVGVSDLEGRIAK
ncbi:hypothetical protein HDU96_005132, partial [Phlyctochytrium bullatum]